MLQIFKNTLILSTCSTKEYFHNEMKSINLIGADFWNDSRIVIDLSWNIWPVYDDAKLF